MGSGMDQVLRCPEQQLILDPGTMRPPLLGHGQVRGVLGRFGVADDFKVTATSD